MAAAPNLTLWGVGTSRTVRPHWALAELGLRYETRAIGPRTGETKTQEYTKLNPRQESADASGRRLLDRRRAQPSSPIWRARTAVPGRWA